ncbi:MAG: lipoate--protein ligase family protein [Myxococcales bacterium]|nr:lipoate--protein ligase family protein [Myxococcales bacterium]
MQIALHREGFPDAPALDTAVSHALLREADAGRGRESLRLYTPGDALAFSVLDRTRPGFPLAVARARAAGFTPILRLAGGHAAVFERGALAFAWTVPARSPRGGIRARFAAIASRIERALRRLGVDARTGEVAGEYCPGEFSVNARGAVKLAGIGQRVLRGAAHVGGVVVVRDAPRVRDVLEQVYEALDLPLAGATTGSVENELPGATAADVAAALIAEIASERACAEVPLPPAALEAARTLAPGHALEIDIPASVCAEDLEPDGKLLLARARALEV